LGELIPAVLEKEKDNVKDVKEACVIFDRTARLGEALVIIIRFVQENFSEYLLSGSYAWKFLQSH
jgi:hypothetical protein